MLICGFLLASVFAGAQARVTITDTLYLADGSLAQGEIEIQWPALTTPDNYTIPQGRTTYTITNGVVSLSLVPNTGSTPANTVYTVRYRLKTATYTEYWTVPATGPTTVRAIRTTPVPTPVVTFGQHQLALGTGMVTRLWLENRAASPSGSANAGQCYWNTTDAAIYCYDGSSWGQISGGGGGGSPGGSTNAVQYKSGASTFGGSTLNATATPMYLYQASSASPIFQQPSATHLSEGTSGSGAVARVSAPAFTATPTASATTVELGSSGAPFGGLHISRTTTSQNERLVLDADNTGILMTGYYPTKGGDVAERSFFRANLYGGIYDKSTDTTHLMADGFSTLNGRYLYLTTYAGDAANSGQAAKSTWLLDSLVGRFDAAGQKIGRKVLMDCASSSDCIGESITITQRGGGTKQGDEGLLHSTINITQGPTPTTGTISAESVTTCNTTTTQAITRNEVSQAVTVASTTGCSVGDWVEINHQIKDAGGAVGANEVVKILAVGAGSITAVFRHSQSSGVTVLPARVVTMSSRVYVGEGNYLVITDGSSYTTGTLNGSSSRNINGSGTTWATNMVGGDSTQVGCFSADNDNDVVYTSLRSWFPIIAVNTTTQIEIAYRLTAGTVTYPGNAASGNYQIRPCARIMRIVDGGSQVVLEANPFTWNGRAYQAIITPEIDMSGMIMRQAGYTVSGGYRGFYMAWNTGTRTFSTAYRAQGSAMLTAGVKGFTTPFSSEGLVDSHYGASGQADTAGVSLTAPLNSSDRQSRFKSGGSYFGEIHDGTSIHMVLEQNGGQNRLTFATPSATVPANATSPLGQAQLDTRNFILKGDSAQSAYLTFDTTRQGGAGIWALRPAATSAAQPTAGNGGIDIHSNSLSRVTMGFTDFGYLAMNSRAAATGVAGQNSYAQCWTYETWTGSAATRRCLFALAAPTSGTYAAGDDPVVEWQVRQGIGAGPGNDSVANVFFGVNTSGALRWRAVATGAGGYAFYATLNTNSLTASRNYTMPDAAGTVELTGHAAKHQNGGADEVATATAGANAIPKAGAGGTLAADWLPNPGASSLGGVRALTCSGTDKLSAIGTDGIPVCSTDQSGGGSAHELLSATHTGTVVASAVLGDLIGGNATPAWERVPGNTTTTRKFLLSVGNGSISAVPAWDTVTKTDVGLANVENTALSTWAGSTAITTLGTISTGTVPWANLSGHITVTAGAGLSGGGAISSGISLATASSEADFLASGALTCGAGTQGKAQVHTTPLQYCDNAATPALQYAAYGDSGGKATAGDSATAFFVSGAIEAARGGTGIDTSGSTGFAKISSGTWSAATLARSFGVSVDGGGSAITTGVAGYTTIPYACTISAWNITVDTGTITFKVWRLATGTAIPTSANSINTSGIGISANTAIHSTTTSDFTSTAIAKDDILGFNIEAVSGATKASLVIQCDQN